MYSVVITYLTWQCNGISSINFNVQYDPTAVRPDQYMLIKTRCDQVLSLDSLVLDCAVNSVY